MSDYPPPPPPPPGGGYPPPPPGGGYTPPPPPSGGGYTPPPPPGGYPGQPGYGYGGVPQSSQKALWSMILGIASIVLCWCCPVIPLGLGGAAMVMGRGAKGDIERSGGALTGAGQAQAGFITGIIGLVLGVAALVATIVIFAADGTFYYNFET